MRINEPVYGFNDGSGLQSIRGHQLREIISYVNSMT